MSKTMWAIIVFTHQFSCMVASHLYKMGKITNRYWVVEGTHKDPNDKDTIDHSTEKNMDHTTMKLWPTLKQ